MKIRISISRFIWLLIASFVLISLGIIPLRLAIAGWQQPKPQAILTLGGFHPREQLAAQLASQYPHLIIWVSSGSDDHITRKIFQDAGISSNRYYKEIKSNSSLYLSIYCLYLHYLSAINGGGARKRYANKSLTTFAETLEAFLTGISDNFFGWLLA